MQVNSVNNNTAFGARLRVKPKDIDHVMETIDSKCDIKGLKRIYNTLLKGETGKGSKDIVYIEDASIRGKKVCPKECGFLKAKVGEWTYGNDVVTTASFWSLPHFFEKIQRLSQAKYHDSWSNSGKRIIEINDQINIMCDRAIDGRAKDALKPSAERDGLLDAIFNIFRKQ